ncbi:MAG: hypothetical protein AAGF10_07390, partial [Verrucomicrobiota bacterium]
GSSLAALYQTTLETRISSGMGEKLPVLSTSAMQAATRAVVQLSKEAERFKPEAFSIVATSAVRDAVNRDAFIQRIEKATGHPLQVLTGWQEAAYIGRAITTDPAFKQYPHFTLIDLGGGSLECIRLRDGNIVAKTSYQVGAVRLMERFVKEPHQPLDDHTAKRIADYVRRKVTQSDFTHLYNQKFLAATGGAVNVARAIRASWLNQSIDETSPVLTKSYLQFLKEEVCSATLENRQRIAELPAARADIMPVACIILLALAEIAGANRFVHSLHNLRFGIAAEMSKEG